MEAHPLQRFTRLLAAIRNEYKQLGQDYDELAQQYNREHARAERNRGHQGELLDPRDIANTWGPANTGQQP